MPRTAIIIPARYESSRFPGKPLVELAGKSMIARVYEIGRAVRNADAVYVATDDARIAAAAEALGAPVIMTSERCRNGTERVAEAALTLSPKPDIVVNLQGDAPLMPPAFIETLIEALAAAPAEIAMATPALRCDAQSLAAFKKDRRAGRVGGTTIAADRQGNALYFSKEVIPFIPEGADPDPIPVFHHVGLYAYRPALLERYRAWEQGPLEKLEQLEQLRVLEQGEKIKVVEVEARGRTFWEINNPEDVARVEAALKAQGEPV